MFAFGIILLIINSIAFIAQMTKEGTIDLGLFFNSVFIALALIIGT